MILLALGRVMVVLEIERHRFNECERYQEEHLLAVVVGAIAIDCRNNFTIYSPWLFTYALAHLWLWIGPFLKNSPQALQNYKSVIRWFFLHEYASLRYEKSTIPLQVLSNLTEVRVESVKQLSKVLYGWVNRFNSCIICFTIQLSHKK